MWRIQYNSYTNKKIYRNICLMWNVKNVETEDIYHDVPPLACDIWNQTLKKFTWSCRYATCPRTLLKPGIDIPHTPRKIGSTDEENSGIPIVVLWCDLWTSTTMGKWSRENIMNGPATDEWGVVKSPVRSNALIGVCFCPSALTLSVHRRTDVTNKIPYPFELRIWQLVILIYAAHINWILGNPKRKKLI